MMNFISNGGLELMLGIGYLGVWCVKEKVLDIIEKHHEKQRQKNLANQNVY